MQQRVVLVFLSLVTILAMLAGCAPAATTTAPAAEEAAPAAEGAQPENVQSENESQVTSGSDVQVPVVAQPCEGDACFCEGKTVTVIVNAAGPDGPISGPIYEVRDEFEAATGGTLEIVETPDSEHFPKLLTDVTSGTGAYDTSIAGMWWIGDLVEGDYILPLDEFYNDDTGKYPEWDTEDVLAGPKNLLTYGGALEVVPNDHDGQVMYYRSDLLADPAHQAAFQEAYGYELKVPDTWDEFRDVAEYFDGKDLNGDGTPDDGLTLHLKVGGQGMFHFMSFAAPFLIGPENPNLFWFDPADMSAIMDSPGHQRAMETLIDLLQFGPEAMMGWSLGESWDHFLRGQAALTFTWGDLGSLAQEAGSQVKGMTGSAPMPGTMEYYNPTAGEWVATEAPNKVGNTTGGSWAGVISKFSDAPDCTYFFLSLMAHPDKSFIYAARGWDGVDPGRFSHMLPPSGTASIDAYVAAGWDAADAEAYTQAYYENFNADLQFPYLRIPGAFEYWTALDVRLSEAATGQLAPAEAVAALAEDFDAITERLGPDVQLESYKASLGLE
jgi:multiple sugar transport system substrate-binding protein